MENKQIQVSITSSTLITAVIIGAAAFAMWTLRDLILLVLTAIVLASALEPGVAGFVKRKVPRVLSVFLMYLLVFGSIFTAIYFVVPPILDDAGNFVTVGSQYLDTFTLPGATNGFTPHLASDKSQLTSMLDGIFVVRNAFNDPSVGAFKIVSLFFGGIFSLVLVTVLSFYFAVQDTGVEEFLRLISPAKNEMYVVNLWHRAQRKIGLWMQGQLLSSLIGGVIAFLGLLILGVPYALLLAVLTAFLMLIPIFGSFLSGLPAVIIAFSTGNVTLAFIVAGLYLIINQFEAHLIHPLVVNKVVGIPPLLVILALIVGGDLAGFLGVVLAIPVAAALRELLSDVSKKKKERAQTA
jgi:predicted PurR-regulated permease PerM